jgi:hypothetical protein
MASKSNPTKLPDTLWHYTTAAGLLGILGNEVTPSPPDNAETGDVTITSSDGFTVSGSDFQAVFRATAIEYLNDHQELIHGLQFLKQAIVDYAEKLEAINYGPTEPHEIANPTDKVKFFRALCDCIDRIADRDYEHHIHCYTTSFSKKPDVLSQWRGYGGGTSGFAIGVDSSKLPKPLGCSPMASNDAGLVSSTN